MKRVLLRSYGGEKIPFLILEVDGNILQREKNTVNLLSVGLLSADLTNRSSICTTLPTILEASIGGASRSLTGLETHSVGLDRLPNGPQKLQEDISGFQSHPPV